MTYQGYYATLTTANVKPMEGSLGGLNPATGRFKTADEAYAEGRDRFGNMPFVILFHEEDGKPGRLIREVERQPQ